MISRFNLLRQIWGGSVVKWYTDSQAAAKIIEVGSIKVDLHRLAITFFQFCAKHSTPLEVQWIPRSENEKADYISRLIDFDGWQITCPRFFLHFLNLTVGFKYVRQLG